MEEARFPIGAWTYLPVREINEGRVEEWRDLGMTLMCGPSFHATPDDIAHMRRVLDWSWERGIRVVVYDPRTMDFRSADYEAGVAAAVSDFGSHPAVYGFFVHDEPKSEDMAAVTAACRVVRRLAPRCEPVVNHFPWMKPTEGQVGYPGWPEYLDAFVGASGVRLLPYDCYEQMNPGDLGTKVYFRNLEVYRAAAERHGIEFWNTVLSVGHYDFRVPTEDDLRWQLWTSLAHGARAVWYFFLYMREPHNNYRLAPYDEMGRRTQTYDALRRVNHGFLRRWGRLMPRLRLRSVTHWPEPTSEWNAKWAPTDRVASVEATREHVILSEFEEEGTQRSYVMVVNNSPLANSYITVGFRGNVRLFTRNWLDDGETEKNLVRQGGVSKFDQYYAPGQGELLRVAPMGGAA